MTAVARTATLANATKGVQQSFGMILMIQAGMTASTQSSAAVGIVGVSFDFDNTIIFDQAHDSTDSAAELAHPGDFLDVFVFIDVRPVLLGIRSWQIAYTRHCHVAFGVRRTLDFVPPF